MRILLCVIGVCKFDDEALQSILWLNRDEVYDARLPILFDSTARSC